MAQPKINALIWDKEDNTYYQKSAYFYTDLKELLSIIMLTDSNNNLHPEDIINFQEKFRQGKIKHCMVVKNHNGNKDESPFQNIKDGGFLIRSRVTKDSLRDNYDVMSSSNRFGWRNNVTYCELSTPRDLNDNEKKIIEEALDQAMGITNQDKVFNLFALLCSAKDVVWKDHANSKHEGQGFYRDNRDRSFLGFTTMDLYHKEDVETRERVAISTFPARAQAYILIRRR